MLNFFKKDSYWLGLILATITPVILFFVLTWLVDTLSDLFTGGFPLIRDQNVIFVSIFLNIVIFPRYLHGDKYDKSGRGIMIVTFVMTGIYVVWRYKDAF